MFNLRRQTKLTQQVLLLLFCLAWKISWSVAALPQDPCGGCDRGRFCDGGFNAICRLCREYCTQEYMTYYPSCKTTCDQSNVTTAITTSTNLTASTTTTEGSPTTLFYHNVSSSWFIGANTTISPRFTYRGGRVAAGSDENNIHPAIVFSLLAVLMVVFCVLYVVLRKVRKGEKCEDDTEMQRMNREPQDRPSDHGGEQAAPGDEQNNSINPNAQSTAQSTAQLTAPLAVMTEFYPTSY